MMPIEVRGPVIASPFTMILPDDTVSRPPTIISRVLLPHPLGPKIATNCPCGTVKLTVLTASTAAAVPAP